jgi:hypothetical protein
VGERQADGRVAALRDHHRAAGGRDGVGDAPDDGLVDAAGQQGEAVEIAAQGRRGRGGRRSSRADVLLGDLGSRKRREVTGPQLLLERGPPGEAQRLRGAGDRGDVDAGELGELSGRPERGPARLRHQHLEHGGRLGPEPARG